jgi:hypothetical protein
MPVSSLHGVNRASKLLVTTAACAALAVSASGCGEKQEPATTGPVVTQSTTATTTTTTPTTTGSPSATVTQFLTAADAERVCDELLTPAFVRKEYKGRKGCIAARKPSDLADRNPKLVVTKRTDSAAIVVAKPRGGRYDGRTLQVTVLQQGNAFRINALVAR